MMSVVKLKESALILTKAPSDAVDAPPKSEGD
jgi:hypothetical protein